MNSNNFISSNYKPLLYAVIRISLGAYLLLHSLESVLGMDEFMTQALSYFEKNSSFTVLTYLIPVVPFVEFFLAVLILSGLYTNLALLWAIAVGAVFMAFFHYAGDLNNAMDHSYTVLIKLMLLNFLSYNKFSLDYYNQWKVQKEFEST